MSKEMVISANPHETRVAILEEGQLCEYYVERDKEFALVGSIYKGKVTRVLPGMQSAFVEIGLDSDAFLYVSDFLEEIEGLDHVETTPDPSKTAAAAGNGGAAAPGLSAPVAGSESLPEGEILSAMEGESLGGSGGGAGGEAGGHAGIVAPVQTSAPSFNRPPQSGQRSGGSGGGYQGRSSGGGGDRGGRNRFGGRGGRNRPGGRGGRSGGGDQRFGRELPSSKYASSSSSSSGYPADNLGAEQAGPEGHISMVLPGESLAKFRERPAGAEQMRSGAEFGGERVSYSGAESATSPLHEIVEPQNPALDAPAGPSDREAALLASFGSFETPDTRPAAAPREHREDRERGRFGRGGSRGSSRSSQGRGGFSSGGYSSGGQSSGGHSSGSSAGGGFSSGIEPLPGESLSKWKAHQHLPPEPPSDNAPVPEAVQFASLSPLMPPGPEVDSADISVASHIDERHVFSEEVTAAHESASERAETDGERESSETHMFRAAPLDSVVERHESASERTETGEPGRHAHEVHAHDDLSEEEVTALAEHIADAQDDLAARDAQERVFAAADAAAEAESDEGELEEEEAAAEEEGMIAHPDLETAGELADEHAEEQGSELEAHDHEHDAAHDEAQGGEGEVAAALGEDGQALSAEAAPAQPEQQVQPRVRTDFRSRMQNPSRRGGRDRGRRDDRGGSRRPHQGHSSSHGGGQSHHRPSAPRRT